MEKEKLHASLLFLMNKLEEIKDNPMQDKRFVGALVEVLRYFRDNGELRKAFKIHKEGLAVLEKSSWLRIVTAMCSAKMDEFGTEIPPIDIKESIAKMASEEYVEQKINEVLGE